MNSWCPITGTDTVIVWGGRNFWTDTIGGKKMNERERLIELLNGAVNHFAFITKENLADYLLSHGVKLSATPCDFCAYDPPSSSDGKPCTMCPARAKEG